MRKLLSLSATLVAVCLPDLAAAHTGLGRLHGLAEGFAHPFSGIDHVLAMVAAGVFAYQRGGASIWMLPTAFLGMMALGGSAGFGGAALPSELGIALSIIALGVLVAVRIAPPALIAVALVGSFAVFHGHAHGAEAAGASAYAYIAGFLLATALLHMVGIALGSATTALAKAGAAPAYATGGGMLVLSGLILTAQAL